MRLVSSLRHLSSMCANMVFAVDSTAAAARHSTTFSERLRMKRGTCLKKAARNKCPYITGAV